MLQVMQEVFSPDHLFFSKDLGRLIGRLACRLAEWRCRNQTFSNVGLARLSQGCVISLAGNGPDQSLNARLARWSDDCHISHHHAKPNLQLRHNDQ